jgi:hypothetical protein
MATRHPIAGGPPKFDLMMALFVGNHFLNATFPRLTVKFRVSVNGDKDIFQAHIEGMKRAGQSDAEWYIEGFFANGMEWDPEKERSAEGFRARYSTTTRKGWFIFMHHR